MFTVRETGYDGVVFRRVDGDDGAVFVKSETLASMFVFDLERLKSRIGTGSFDIRGYTLPESRIEAFTGLDPWFQKLHFSFGVRMKGDAVGGVVLSPFLGVCDPYHGIHDVGADDTNRTVLERSSVTLSKKVCNYPGSAQRVV